MLFYQWRDSILTSPAKRDKIILANLLLSLAINVFLWLTLILVLSARGQYIILGYNMYFGISAFGPWYNILLIPILSLLVIALNFSLSFYLYLKEIILSYFLAAVALIFNLLLLVSALIIIYVNI